MDFPMWDAMQYIETYVRVTEAQRDGIFSGIDATAREEEQQGWVEMENLVKEKLTGSKEAKEEIERKLKEAKAEAKNDFREAKGDIERKLKEDKQEIERKLKEDKKEIDARLASLLEDTAIADERKKAKAKANESKDALNNEASARKAMKESEADEQQATAKAKRTKALAAAEAAAEEAVKSAEARAEEAVGVKQLRDAWTKRRAKIWRLAEEKKSNDPIVQDLKLARKRLEELKSTGVSPPLSRKTTTTSTPRLMANSSISVMQVATGIRKPLSEKEMWRRFPRRDPPSDFFAYADMETALGEAESKLQEKMDDQLSKFVFQGDDDRAHRKYKSQENLVGNFKPDGAVTDRFVSGPPGVLFLLKYRNRVKDGTITDESEGQAILYCQFLLTQCEWRTRAITVLIDGAYLQLFILSRDKSHQKALEVSEPLPFLVEGQTGVSPGRQLLYTLLLSKRRLLGHMDGLTPVVPSFTLKTIRLGGSSLVYVFEADAADEMCLGGEKGRMGKRGLVGKRYCRGSARGPVSQRRTEAMALKAFDKPHGPPGADDPDWYTAGRKALPRAIGDVPGTRRNEKCLFIEYRGDVASERLTWSHFGPLVNALRVAHHHRIVHRDIRPYNITLDDDGPCLIDWADSMKLGAIDLVYLPHQLVPLRVSDPGPAQWTYTAADDLCSLVLSFIALTESMGAAPILEDGPGNPAHNIRETRLEYWRMNEHQKLLYRAASKGNYDELVRLTTRTPFDLDEACD